MLERVVIDVSRHLLEPAQWARERLSAHTGKQIRVDHVAGTLSVRIDENGFLAQADGDVHPELVVVMTPVAVLKWLTDRKAGWREARVEGDMELAAAISHVMANLRWDYEEDLSRLVGDIAAHRIGSGVRRASAWPGTAAESAARAMAEFLSEERHLLVTPLGFDTFSTDVDALRDAAERLEKRLERLEKAMAVAAPQKA